MISTERESPGLIDGVFYPAEDGVPMAETGIHIDAIFRLREILEDWYRGRSDVWIGNDQFWYYERGNNKACCAPDIMVVFGVEHPGHRRSYFTWIENNIVPSFICEFPSKESWRNDTEGKLRLFEKLGVKEYFVFDPEAVYLDPPFQGWRLNAAAYQAIASNADASLTSEELGLRLQVEGTYLRLFDVRTGKKLLSRAERLDEAAQEIVAKETEIADKDAEIARLKAEIEALSKKDGA